MPRRRGLTPDRRVCRPGRRICRSIYLSHLATTHLSNILCGLKRFVGRGFSRDIPVSEKRGFRAFCVTTFFVGKPRKRKIAAAPAFPNLRMQHLVPQSPPCHTSVRKKGLSR